MISGGATVTGCDLTCDAVIADGANCVDLSGLVTEGYIPAFPVSPDGTGSWSTTYTGYYMTKNANGSVTVGACESENVAAISVTQ